jgi:hypothetical protein
MTNCWSQLLAVLSDGNRYSVLLLGHTHRQAPIDWIRMITILILYLLLATAIISAVDWPFPLFRVIQLSIFYFEQPLRGTEGTVRDSSGHCCDELFQIRTLSKSCRAISTI